MRALVTVAQADCRAVGGIIYDGILVEKVGSETSVPESMLRGWEDAVRAKTGMSIKLVVKRMSPPPEWGPSTRPVDGSSTDAPVVEPEPSPDEGETWMDGRHLHCYYEVKSRW